MWTLDRVTHTWEAILSRADRLEPPSLGANVLQDMLSSFMGQMQMGLQSQVQLGIQSQISVLQEQMSREISA